jgi:hypothetical protein
MKVIIDRDRIRRRAQASHAASLGGLLTMLASVAVSLFRPDLATLTLVMLLAGFAAASIGIYFANRWVKKPRPEEVLDQALKGLDDHHRLYHYLPKGSDHLLLTPRGLVPLITRSGEGEYSYADGRWKQRITMGKALRFFVEEPLGDPIVEARAVADRLAACLRSALPEGSSVPIHPMVVFTHPAASLDRKGNPLPVCQPKQLKGELPKTLPSLKSELYEQLRELLDRGGPC